jgi:hypothetical protein
MTLLGRAPREVYRVYGEDEFFAGPGLATPIEAPSSRAERGLHRAAGATVLVAAVGAVGALVALTSFSSTTRAGRRVGSGPLASTNSIAASRSTSTHVWHEPAGANGSRRRRMGEPPRLHAMRVAGPILTADHHARVEVVDRAGSPPVELADASGSSEMAAGPAPQQGASSGVTRPGPSEFGFER